MKTSTGPSPTFPVSITRNETPSATSTMREDPALGTARDNVAPMQIKAIESATGRVGDVIAATNHW
jgi:hypothetical protein